jgi:uncharacterized protein (DUF2336 family)
MPGPAPPAATPKRNAKCGGNQSLIDELNDAIATGGGDKERQRILERIADLFAAGSRGYSSDQIALFDDVLQKLSADIELKARARLARRLAHFEGAPPKLIRSLAFDDAIEVAEPVLVHSQQLSDADLVENATTKSQEHLFAIAQRHHPRSRPRAGVRADRDCAGEARPFLRRPGRTRAPR